MIGMGWNGMGWKYRNDKVAARQVSKDGTKKLAYRLSDGQVIESVLMPYSDGRRTACISSQAGCAMGCVFCATGQVRDVVSSSTVCTYRK